MLIEPPKVGRPVVAATTLGVVTLGLAGCQVFLEHQATGPIAIAEAGGQLKVVVCVDAVAGEVIMSERPSGEAWGRFYTAEGQISLQAGDEILASTHGLEQTSTDPTLSPRADLLVLLVRRNDSEVTPPQAAFVVPEDGLPEGGWLHPDGSVTTNACDGVD